ncbi:MAG: hypothetical protein R3B12_01080 [Candidatus Saccharimonadales bacterium]
MKYGLVSGGTVDTASADGDLYVQDFLEVDGSSSIAGSLTMIALIHNSHGAANRLDLATGDSLNLVSGNIQQNGTNRLTTAGLSSKQQMVQLVAGTNALVTYCMGMYRIDANNLGFSVAGTERLRVTTTGAQVTGDLTL